MRSKVEPSTINLSADHTTFRTEFTAPSIGVGKVSRMGGFSKVPLMAFSTMLSRVLSTIFSTAFLLSSLQLRLG